MAIGIGAASAAIQRDPYAAFARRSNDARTPDTDDAIAAASRASPGSAAEESAEAPAAATRAPRGESVIRPVTVLREAQASGPARAALASYRSVEQNSVSVASEGELVGIDVFV